MDIWNLDLHDSNPPDLHGFKPLMQDFWNLFNNAVFAVFWWGVGSHVEPVVWMDVHHRGACVSRPSSTQSTIAGEYQKPFFAARQGDKRQLLTKRLTVNRPLIFEYIWNQKLWDFFQQRCVQDCISWNRSLSTFHVLYLERGLILALFLRKGIVFLCCIRFVPIRVITLLFSVCQETLSCSITVPGACLPSSFLYRAGHSWNKFQWTRPSWGVSG